MCGKCRTTILDNLFRKGTKCSEVESKDVDWGECQNVKSVAGDDVKVDDMTSATGSRCFGCKQSERLQAVEE